MFLTRLVRVETQRSAVGRQRWFSSSASNSKWGSLNSSKKRPRAGSAEAKGPRQRLINIDDFRKTVDSFYNKVDEGVAPMSKINANMATYIQVDSGANAGNYIVFSKGFGKGGRGYVKLNSATSIDSTIDGDAWSLSGSISNKGDAKDMEWLVNPITISSVDYKSNVSVWD